MYLPFLIESNQLPPFFTILRFACMAQITLSGFVSIRFLMYASSYTGFSSLVQLLSFILAVWLAVFSIRLLQSNYPDIPVAGHQKTIFNWLFLINFFMLAFHFAYVISDVKALVKISTELRLAIHKFPPGMFISLLLYTIIALLQITILYGLFRLRRTLYNNFCRNLSDLEKK